MDEQPQQKKRKWDVPGPATLSQPAPMIAAAGLGSILGKGVGGTQAASSTPAVNIALAQAAAAALFSKYHPGAQVKLPANSSAGVANAPTEAKPAVDLSREVFINDAPTGVRIHLTKRGVQDEIQSRTGTIIVTRGRYYPPGAVPDGNEKPLHLLVKPALQAGSTDEQKQQAVSNAVSDIQRILQGIQTAPRTAPPASVPHSAPPYGAPPPGHPAPQRPPQPAPGYPHLPPPYGAPPPGGYPAYMPASHPAPPPSGPAPPQRPAGPGLLAGPSSASAPGAAAARPGSGGCNVYMGISNPGSFPVAEKIRGPGGSFLQHISAITGATLQLRGHGSGEAEGPDPLHVFVSAPVAKGLEDAKSLLLDLLRTVSEEFKQANPALAHTVQQPAVTQLASAPPTSHGAAAAPPPYPPPMYGAAAPSAGAPPYYLSTGQPYYPPAGTYPPSHAYGGPPPPYTAPPYQGVPPPYPYAAAAAPPGVTPPSVPPYHYPPATTPPYGTAPAAHPPSQPLSSAPPARYVASAPPAAVPPQAAAPASAVPAAPRPYGIQAAPAAAPPPSGYAGVHSVSASAAPSSGASVYGNTAHVNGFGSTAAVADGATAGAAPPKRKFREAREGEQARPSPPPSDNPYAQYAQAMGRNQQGNAGSNNTSATGANNNNNKHAWVMGNGGMSMNCSGAGSGGGERAAVGSAGATAPTRAPPPEGAAAAAAAQAPPASSGAQVTGSLQGLIGYYDGDD